MKLENAYKPDLMKRIASMFPGCIILQIDSSVHPGMPDRLILIEDWWAALEVKKSAKEVPRPNQPYYVALMDKLSFAAFIYPENEEEVLDALQRSFRSRRYALVSESE